MTLKQQVLKKKSDMQKHFWENVKIIRFILHFVLCWEEWCKKIMKRRENVKIIRLYCILYLVGKSGVKNNEKKRKCKNNEVYTVFCTLLGRAV